MHVTYKTKMQYKFKSVIKTDKASSNHYVLTVDTTRHRLANQKKKTVCGGKIDLSR